MAVVGFIFGILSLLCSTVLLFVIPESIIAAPLFAGIGLPLSWVALRRSRMLATGVADLSLVGLVINIVALVFIIGWIIVLYQEGVFS